LYPEPQVNQESAQAVVGDFQQVAMIGGKTYAAKLTPLLPSSQLTKRRSVSIRLPGPSPWELSLENPGQLGFWLTLYHA
jgi:hypothetical protein